MEDNLVLGWGIAVDDAALGADIEVYASTKSRITTFKLCVKYAIGAMAKLSPELIDMITSQYFRVITRRSLRQWEKMQRCMKRLCHPRDHYTKREFQDLLDEADGSYEQLYDVSMEDKGVIHSDRYHTQKHKLCNTESAFCKAKKVFKNDFEVKANFNVLYCDEDIRYAPERAEVSAQLLEPVHTAHVKMSNDWHDRFFAVSTRIQGKDLNRPTETQCSHLFAACKKLNLTPEDEDEDEEASDFDWEHCYWNEDEYETGEDEVSSADESSDEDIGIRLADSQPRTSAKPHENRVKDAADLSHTTVDEQQKEKAATTRLMQGWPKLMIVGSGKGKLVTDH